MSNKFKITSSINRSVGDTYLNPCANWGVT